MAKVVIRTNIDADLNGALGRLNTELDDLARSMNPKDPEIQKALEDAAIQLRDAIRDNTPEANRVITRRFKNGKIARYHPGNLKRAIQVFEHMKDRTNKYVGPYVKPKAMDKSGDFKGDTVDGWYAHIVEANTPFIRPAVFQNEDAIMHRLHMALTRIINKRVK